MTPVERILRDHFYNGEPGQHEAIKAAAEALRHAALAQAQTGCGDPSCKDPECTYGKGPNTDPLYDSHNPNHGRSGGLIDPAQGSPEALANKVMADPTMIHLRECGFQPAARFEATVKAAVMRACAVSSTSRGTEA